MGRDSVHSYFLLCGWFEQIKKSQLSATPLCWEGGEDEQEEGGMGG